MAQPPKAVDKPESAETQAPASPAEDKKTPAPAEAEQKSEQPEVKAEEPELADKTRERMHEFTEKLKEKDRMIDDLSQQISALRTPVSSKTEQEADLMQYVTPDGKVDVEGLNKAFKTISQRAVRAEQTTQSFIQTQQEREAYTAHPQLNPDSKDFDSGLHKTARALITDSMMHPQDYGGRPLTFREAADQALEMSPGEKAKVEKQARKDAFKQVSTKEAASLEASGTSGRGRAIQSDAELEALRKQSRKEGAEGLDAIAERLKNLPLRE